MVLCIFSLYLSIYILMYAHAFIYTYTFAHRMHHQSKLKTIEWNCVFVSTRYIDCLRFGLHSILESHFRPFKNRKVWTSPKKWHFPTESSFSQLPAKWESHLSFPWFHDISRRKNLAFNHDISEDPYKQLPQGLLAMAKIQSETGVVSPPISGLMGPYL